MDNSFKYALEEINEDVEVSKKVEITIDREFNEGDLIEFIDDKWIFLENETNNEKNKMQSRLNNLFNK
ncbi:MAG: hypothetical protein ACK5LV_07605 [Lachnospirales bacterium]